MQYCDVLEGGPLRGRPKRNTFGSATSVGPINQPQDTGQTENNTDPYKVPFSVASKPPRATKEYLKNSEKPEAYFQYFANKGLPDRVRFQIYHNAGCVTRHFDAIHLKEEPLKCNWCEVALLHQMAFQRHAFDVHRVRSRQRCANPVQELQRQE